MSELDYHPLFLPEDGISPEGYAPEPIMHIELIRSGHQGEIRIPRTFAPDELTSYEQIAELYGGGLYHVRARRHDGTYYAKRRVHLAGRPKPLDLETGAPAAAVAPAPLAVAPSAPAGMTADPMFALLLSQMQESQRAMTTIMAAAMTALAGRGETAADTMRAVVPLLAPLMTPREQPAPNSAPLREVLEVSKLIRDEARAMDARREDPPPPPDDMAGQIKGIVEAVAPIMLHVASSTSGGGTPTGGGL